MVVSVALLGSFIYSIGSSKTGSPKTMRINEVNLSIAVADTDAERQQGLSGRTAGPGDPLGLGLGENEALLFIFDRPGYHSFWMKDMNFSIDVAWLDKNKKIVHIENDIGPETYPEAFSSPYQSLYVIETPAGFLENHGIKIGDVADF